MCLCFCPFPFPFSPPHPLSPPPPQSCPATCSYSQALAATAAARAEFERLGLPHRRPADFLAEMLKTDEQMGRIKSKLLLEAAKITAVDGRRRQKEGEAFRKASAAEKARARAAEKRATLDSVKQWRKHGGAGGSAPPPDVDAALAGGALSRGGRGGSTRGGVASGSFKRARKDEKFGFGGRKKATKANDSASASATTGLFSAKRMKAPLPGFAAPRGGGVGKGGGRGGGKGSARGGKRPGQAARRSSAGKSGQR